jgi:hypothetical protein
MLATTAVASPRALARLAGWLYLVTIGLGIVVQFAVKDAVMVPGDAAATFANLTAMSVRWRLGIVAELVLIACTVPTVVALYLLLAPVNRTLALMSSCFGLLGAAVEGSHALKLVEALFPVGKAAYLAAFEPAQLHAMAALSIRGQAVGFGVALFFFGPYFLLNGRLIAASGYFPRLIGRLYQVAGLGYLANTLVLLLAPRFAGLAFMAMVLPVLAGEGSFCVWLLLRGVDEERWRARALTAPVV